MQCDNSFILQYYPKFATNNSYNSFIQYTNLYEIRRFTIVQTSYELRRLSMIIVYESQSWHFSWSCHLLARLEAFLYSYRRISFYPWTWVLLLYTFEHNIRVRHTQVFSLFVYDLSRLHTIVGVFPIRDGTAPSMHKSIYLIIRLVTSLFEYAC